MAQRKLAEKGTPYLEASKSTEIHTSQGIRTADLIDEPTIMAIAEYFAFDAGRYRTEAAKQFYRAIAQAGLRAYHYTIAGYAFNVQPKVKARSIPNYLPSRKECMDTLRDYGAKGGTYAAVEAYNNALEGLESGQRDSVTYEQACGLAFNYMGGTIELLKRERGFHENQSHLRNACKKGMRHRKYEVEGEDVVPEALKPKKERKSLKAK